MLSWWMLILLGIYFIICFLMMGVILIQSGKGGGLSSLGSSAGGITDALGATGLEKTLNKVTTGIAIAFGLFAMGLSILGSMRARSPSDTVLGATHPQIEQTIPGTTLPPIGLDGTPGESPGALLDPVEPLAPDASAPSGTLPPVPEASAGTDPAAPDAAPAAPAPAVPDPADPAAPDG